MTHTIEVVRLVKAGGPLTKRISLTSAGEIRSDGSACIMSTGTAHRERLPDLTAFASMIGQLETNEAIALGALREDLPDDVELMTKSALRRSNKHSTRNVIARTSEHILFRPKQPALALIDFDTKGLPRDVAKRIQELGGFQKAIMSVAPCLASAGCVIRQSTSSGIFRTDTREQFAGSGGVHLFVLVEDGADIERFLRTLHDRCWLAGLGWMMIGAGGQLLERSPVDRMVYAPERLVFEGPPILDPPLAQDQASRAPRVTAGGAVDTRLACPVLSQVEAATLEKLRCAATRCLRPAAEHARSTFASRQAAVLAERQGISDAMARKVVQRHCDGTLLPAVMLPFDDPELAGTTVGEVLRNPENFVGETLADPLEGPDYGRCKAKIMRRADGTLWIHSFAHGRTVYELRHDHGSIDAALDGADAKDAAAIFVKHVLAGDLTPDEEQRLREKTMAKSGVKARPLVAMLKAARAEQKQWLRDEDRASREESRTDPRTRLKVPALDSERVPVIQTIDEVLIAVADAEPPMRDIDGHTVEVRNRRPLMLHELTGAGCNDDEKPSTRLPPPEMPLLTLHDRYSLAHLIERHIEYVEGNEEGAERPVALPPVFVEHYMAYRDSGLPRVGAVVTNPLVLADGRLLAPVGLDRERNLVFRIDPALLRLMPRPEDCTADAVSAALDFLVNDWLCDVAADFAGKCVLISAALTILERALLPERPAFFITAGQRGGGKTTAASMVIAAATGARPAAAAWSLKDDERRKAMLAYLAEGLPVLVWDNIPRGSAISCPTIEKVLTSATYSDRILGESTSKTVPATTVQIFTGNNIAPRSDLASRSWQVRLDVNRPDPENRNFHHADPVTWTLNNRGEILGALYTVLLGNPQLQAQTAKRTQTRFKTWWHLIGSAVEHAAARLVAAQTAAAAEGMYSSTPAAELIEFGKLILDHEADDEATNVLASILDILASTWPDRSFSATEVAASINSPMADESDNGKALRELLDQVLGDGRPMAPVSALSISTRLKAVADAPTSVGDRVLVLKRTLPAGKKHDAIRFQVLAAQ